jgi:hypothetical protein
MEQTNVLGGPAEVAINGTTIPAQLLSEVAVELTEGTRERETLGGTFNRPSGVFDTAQATFTMFLPSMDYLKDIFPDLYNTPSGGQTTGNLIFGTGSCSVRTGGPVNIHYSCEDTDDNDIYFYNALAQLNFNPTYNATDDLQVEVTLLAQPDDDGNIARLGTGDLTQPSVYDPVTETTVPLGSS